MTARESSESVPFVQDNKGFLNSSPPPACPRVRPCLRDTRILPYMGGSTDPARRHGPTPRDRAGAGGRRGGCRGAGGIFQRGSGEEDLHGILESTAGQLDPRTTTSWEGFALWYLEQL